VSKEYTDDSYRAAYDRFLRSQKSGACEECGWKDGDGVKTCFYSSAIGTVTHEDSPQAVRARMSESQRSLLDSYDSYLLLPWDAESEILDLRAAAAGRADEDGGEAWIEFCLTRTPNLRPANFGKTVPHRYAVEYDGWLTEPWWIPSQLRPPEFWPSRRRRWDLKDWISYEAGVYRPHSCGQGHGQHRAAYHVYCTGCLEEVKLWEFGVDPDCG
jgi:hypothetical protein